MTKYLSVFLGSFVLALIFTPVMRLFAARYKILERPNERRVHKTPVPILGGVAIYLSFVLIILSRLPMSENIRNITGILLGGTMIIFLGVADDILGLSPKFKFLGQMAAAVLLFFFGITIKGITNPFNGYLSFSPPLSVLATVLWVVGITNALNFIDGLDGLAAGTAFIAGGALMIMSYLRGQGECVLLAAALSGCALGFLPYNFNPAKIFMGDTGSMFLGFVLSAIAILGPFKISTAMAVFVPVLVLGLPIFDTLFAILRRVRNRKPIYQADKGHLHHRLLERGLSQRKVVLILYSVTIVLCAIAFLLMK